MACPLNQYPGTSRPSAIRGRAYAGFTDATGDFTASLCAITPVLNKVRQESRRTEALPYKLRFYSVGTAFAIPVPTFARRRCRQTRLGRQLVVA